jgi:hypothetical protein
MARIRPLDSSATWSDECIDVFESLSCCALWKPIYAKILAGNQKSDGRGEDKAEASAATVELFTLEGEKNIAEELVKQGFVKIVR